MKKYIFIFIFAFYASATIAEQSDSTAISMLQLEVKQALLEIEKAEIDRRVEYLQHEQNKFLSLAGIGLAVLGVIITVAGFVISKNLGEKFDAKEEEMENRMRLLEDKTALRLEKLNMEVNFSEQSLDLIKLKIDEAVRQAVAKVETKTEDETEKFKAQIQKIVAESKNTLNDIQSHSDRAKDLVAQIEKSNGKLSPKLKKEVKEQVEKTREEKTEEEYNGVDWILNVYEEYNLKSYNNTIRKAKAAIAKYPYLSSFYYFWDASLIEIKTPTDTQVQEFKDALTKGKEIPELWDNEDFQKIYNKYFPQQ